MHVDMVKSRKAEVKLTEEKKIVKIASIIEWESRTKLSMYIAQWNANYRWEHFYAPFHCIKFANL